MASASGIRMGKVFVEIGGDPAQFFAVLKGVEQKVASIGNASKRKVQFPELLNSLKAVQKTIASTGSAMQSLGTKMAGVGAAISVPLGLAVRQFATFDDAIRATAAVSGVSGAALQKLNDKARDLGATTSFTAVQVANLMTELGRAGFKPDEINAMTAAVLDLSRASGTDAVRASGIMAATLRQFGLGATEATRAADVLTTAANATFNSVDSLGEALKYAGPVARSLGMSLEDTTAILGVLGNVGIQGSEAGTALRRLSVISAGAGENLKQLFGISNTDMAGNLKPLVDILDEINTVTASMPVAERTKRMAEAFGLLGITSANVLSQSAGGVRKLSETLREAQGTAAKTAKEMDAGLGGSIRIMLSAIEGTALAIGDALAPSLMAVMKGIEDTAGGITRFVKNNKELVLTITKGVAIFVGVAAAITGVGAALSLVAGAMGLVLSPVGAVLAAVGGISFALVQASGGFSEFADIANSTFSGIYAAIAEGDLAGAMDVLWAGLHAGWLKGIEGIVVAWHKAVGEIAKAFIVIGSAWDKYVTKPAQMFGVRVAEAAKEREVLGAFDITQGTIWDNESKKAARERQQTAMDVLSSNSAESFAANRAAAEKNIANLQKVVDKGAESGATEAERKAADAAGKEIEAYNNAIQMVKERFAQLGIKTEEERAAAIKEAQDQIDAGTAASIDATRAGTADAAAGVEAKARGKRETRAQNQQFADLLKNIENASSMDQLRDLYGEFDALSTNGRLTSSQVTTLEEALTDAQERIQKSGASMGGSPADRIRGGADAAAGEAAKSQTEVAGTFSSMAIGGMGFGSSLAQKQLDELKGIRKELEKDGEMGVAA